MTIELTQKAPRRTLPIDVSGIRATGAVGSMFNPRAVTREELAARGPRKNVSEVTKAVESVAFASLGLPHNLGRFMASVAAARAAEPSPYMPSELPRRQWPQATISQLMGPASQQWPQVSMADLMAPQTDPRDIRQALSVYTRFPELAPASSEWAPVNSAELADDRESSTLLR